MLIDRVSVPLLLRPTLFLFSHSQMDYRSLVHEKDEALYSEMRVMLLDVRGYYVSVGEGKENLLGDRDGEDGEMCLSVDVLT